MKLGPFEFRRRVVAAAENLPKPPQVEGASGTINISGYLQSTEYVPELRGNQALQIYKRMLSSDGSVQEALEHIYAPIRNGSWEIEPASDDPQDLEVAAFVEQAYFEWLKQPFLEYLDQALDYLSYGFNVFETSYQVIESDLTYTDTATGESVTVPRRQFVTWKRFEQRLQSTIWQWHVTDGELDAVTQQAFKDGNFGNFTMPASQLLVFTNKRRGDDFTGRSLLRAAYKPWFMKEQIEKVSGVAVERHGVGIPVGYLPESARNDSEMVARLESILQNLRAGEFSYIVIPGPKQTGSSPGFVVEILAPPGGIPDFVPLLSFHRAEIKASVLARFAELGHQTAGARATGDVQSIVWFAALHSVARYFTDVNQLAIQRLVDMNYQVDCYPKLNVSGLEQRNLGEFAMAVGQVTSAGAITVDKSWEEFVRREFDAPDMDDPAESEPSPPGSPTPPRPRPGEPGYQTEPE